MEWIGNKIKIDPPKKPKKITGTRLASIFGLNRWTTPFATWCEITKTYQEPFEDTKYTLAGKAIEPKQIEYMKKAYFMTDIKTPTDIYGENYFNKTYGDFYPEYKVFGGMWDALRVNEYGEIKGVLEFKTTKRAEDWQGEIPEYYALQAALYAYLSGVDDVIMVCSFLEEKDYEAPEKFVPSAENTITVPFKVSERYPDFERTFITPAIMWWDAHVEGGLSPVYDEKSDAEILNHLRTNNLNPDSDIESLLAEAEEIKAKLDRVAESVAKDSKRLDVITKQIKEHAMSQFRDGDKKVTINGKKLSWSLSKTESLDIDKDALSADGILEKYSKPKTTYRLTSTILK